MAWYSKSALQPNSNITRQEVCAMIGSIQHLDGSDTYSNVEPFDDSKAIPDWSISYLDAFVQNGYILGYPEKTLRPTGFITRAEVMTILDKSTGYFINKSGNYGSEGEIEIYEGNLTINNPDVSLKNIIVKGHLILAAGIEQGDVALTNVTVVGKTIINGGGADVTGSETITNANQQILGIDVTSLADGTLTLSVRLTDSNGHIGTDVTDTVFKDIVAPSGYGASIDIANVDNTNNTDFSFTLSGAEVGDTCFYTISSNRGGIDVTGNKTITNANQQISGIDASNLDDGTLTLSIILKDAALNTGIASTDTVTKDADPPSGYGVAIDQSQINAANQTAVSFTFESAEISATYEYTLVSSGGTLTGSGIIIDEDLQISGIDVTSLAVGTLTLTAQLTDAVGHVGINVTDTVIKDTTSPTGYSVSIDPVRVNTTNINSFAFTLNNAEIGTTCDYTISSNGGGTDMTGNVAVTSEDQQISGIDVSTLPDGILTLSISLTDTALNAGVSTSDTVVKDTTPPSGYSVSFDQSNIHSLNKTAISFTFTNAEVGSTYAYTVSNSNGGVPLTGSGTISTLGDQIMDIDTSGLADGMITLSCTLTDSDNNVSPAVTATVRKSPYADLRISGYDIYYNSGVQANADGNGIYIYDGMRNNKPSYIYQFGAETFILQWGDTGYRDEWSVTDTLGDSYYFIDSNTLMPPTSGWKYTCATSTVDSDFYITVVTP